MNTLLTNTTQQTFCTSHRMLARALLEHHMKRQQQVEAAALGGMSKAARKLSQGALIEITSFCNRSFTNPGT